MTQYIAITARVTIARTHRKRRSFFLLLFHSLNHDTLLSRNSLTTSSDWQPLMYLPLLLPTRQKSSRRLHIINLLQLVQRSHLRPSASSHLLKYWMNPSPTDMLFSAGVKRVFFCFPHDLKLVSPPTKLVLPEGKVLLSYHQQPHLWSSFCPIGQSWLWTCQKLAMRWCGCRRARGWDRDWGLCCWRGRTCRVRCEGDECRPGESWDASSPGVLVYRWCFHIQISRVWITEVVVIARARVESYACTYWTGGIGAMLWVPH